MVDNNLNRVSEFELDKLDLIILQENLNRIRMQATTIIPPAVTGTLGVIFTVAALFGAKMIDFAGLVYGLGLAGSILGGMVYHRVVYTRKKYEAAQTALESKINSMKEKYSNNSHNSAPEPKGERPRTKLEEGANWATIFGTVAAIILLGIAVWGIRSSEDLLNQTKQSTENLKELIDKSNKQLQVLNNTVTQISHQTIMQAYLDGKPFQVDMKNCWYNLENKTITYSPQILDANGDLTPLKFKLVISFGYYTLATVHGSPQYGDVASLSPNDDLLIEPGRQQSFQRSLLNVLEETKNSNDPFLYVRSQYNFAPYSGAIDSILTDYVKDEEGHLIIAFKKNESTGQWELLTTNQNVICK